MGIGIEVRNFEQQIIDRLGLKWADIALCELGNQKIKFRKPRISSKKFYYELGVKEHISIDINGKNKALPLDLDDPVPSSLHNRFDVITNYGTIEHINNQYQAFKNMHDMCKSDGIMIHSLPPVGHWPGHARYYYTEENMTLLAQLCQYEIIDNLQRIKREGGENQELLFVAYRKHKESFITQSEFFTINIEDTGDTSTTGNYTNLTKKWQKKIQMLYTKISGSSV